MRFRRLAISALVSSVAAFREGLAAWMPAALGLAALAGCASSQQIRVPPGVTFLDLDGSHVSLPQRDPAVPTVLIFITADCPVSNGYAPEINQMVRDYKDSPVEFDLVHVDSDLTLDEAQRHAREYQYQCRVLLDPKHSLSEAVGATITPEAAVIDRRGLLAYRGRIDDRYIELGKKRQEAAHRNLRDAIDAVIADRPPPVARTTAVGCYIPESHR
jgi:Redoxin